MDALYAPFAYCFPNGLLTVIDAFLTGLVSSNVMNSLHAVPLFPPLSRLQIETYIAPLLPLAFLPSSLQFLLFFFFFSVFFFFSAIAERIELRTLPLSPIRLEHESS